MAGEREGTITSLSDVEAGMWVEAQDRFGKWFVSKVVEVDEDENDVLVHFDGWSSRYDEYLEVGTGRLRWLSDQARTRQQDNKKKELMVDDRVQAKWEDGRMYFGKVTQIFYSSDQVEVLYDDGVKHVTSIASVRKRKLDKSPATQSSDDASARALAALRSRRAEKRRRMEDSGSQASFSSPPSSPMFVPKRTRTSRIIEYDSTETESDPDESLECPKKHSSRDSDGGKESKRRLRLKRASPESSDSDQISTSSRTQGLNSTRPKRAGLPSYREPYKLRRAPHQPRPSAKATGDVKTTPSRPEGVSVMEDDSIVTSAEAVPQSVGHSSHTGTVSHSHIGPDDVRAGNSSQDVQTVPTRRTAKLATAAKPTKVTSSQAPHSTPELATVSPPPGSTSPSKRSLSDSSALPSGGLSLPKAGGGVGLLGSKKRTTSASQSSVTTRNRAQTIFENMTKKQERKPGKLAPKELVIVWDHNEHKCHFPGCNKSFRKESLLLSHQHHYHEIKPKASPIKTKMVTGPSTKDKPPSKFPDGQTSSAPVNPVPTTPTAAHRSLLSSISREDSSGGATQKQQMKSPTGAFLEMAARERKSEVLKLLEQSSDLQPHASLQSTPAHGSPGSTTIPSNQAARTSTSGQQKNKALKFSPPTASKKKTKASLSLSDKSRPHVLQSPTSLKKAMVEVQVIPHESLPPSPILKSKQSPLTPRTTASTSKAHSAPRTLSGSTALAGSSGGVAGRQYLVASSAEPPEQLWTMDMEDVGVVQWVDSRSPSPTESESDDVVYCVCGSTVDEGFMIQCEQCLCWQHGDCIGITRNTLPEKYVCCICTNPPGERVRTKYKYDRDFYADGMLPSFPGAPRFAHQSAMKTMHNMGDAIYKLRKMAHSTKVKLQAASKPNHPYMREWAKECAHLSQSDMLSYLMNALQPVFCDSSPPEAKSTSGSPEPNSTATNAVVKTVGGVDESGMNQNGGGGEAMEEGREDDRRVGPLEVERGDDATVEKTVGGDGLVEQHVTRSKLREMERKASSASTSTEQTTHGPKRTKVVNAGSIAPPSDTTGHSEAKKTRQHSNTTNQSIEASSKGVSLSSVPHSYHKSVSPPTTSASPPLTIDSSTRDIPRSSGLAPLNQSGIPQGIAPSSRATTVPSCSPTPAVKQPKPSSVKFESLVSDQDFNEGFGMPELAVFALDSQLKDRAKHAALHRGTGEPASSSSRSHPSTSTTELLASPRSAFRRVVPSSAPSTSHLTSLLGTTLSDSKAESKPSEANTTSGVPPSQSSLSSPQPSSTVTSPVPTAKPKPVASLPQTETPLKSISLQTASPAGGLDVIPLGDFAQALLHGEGVGWCHRMLLMDHIEAVQDKITAWMDIIEKQLDELPAGMELDPDETESLIKQIHSTVNELHNIQHVES